MADIKTVQIYLDLDGVISDFDGHATARGKRKTNGSPDYDALDHEWWSSMPAFPGAREFYEELKTQGPVDFLTGPIPNPTCFSGKAEWLMKFLPERGRFALQDVIVCPARKKFRLAEPNAVLIDDRFENIEAWRQAGGIGILHKGDYADTLARVEGAIAAYQAPAPFQPKFLGGGAGPNP